MEICMDSWMTWGRVMFLVFNNFCSIIMYSNTREIMPHASIFTFPLWVFKWTFTFEMWFITSWTNRFKPHPHTRHLSGLTSSPSNNVACLLTFVWRSARIALTLSAEIWRFGYSKPYVMSDLIQNIWKTNQVRQKLKIDTWLIIYNVNISNKLIFWKVHGIMNTSGILQS